MMAAIVAPAGSGKSLVLKALADETRGIYVYCQPNVTVRELLYKIALALGYRADRRRPASRDCPPGSLNSFRGTKRRSISDEAQKPQQGDRCGAGDL